MRDAASVALADRVAYVGLSRLTGVALQSRSPSSSVSLLGYARQRRRRHPTLRASASASDGRQRRVRRSPRRRSCAPDLAGLTRRVGEGSRSLTAGRQRTRAPYLAEEKSTGCSGGEGVRHVEHGSDAGGHLERLPFRSTFACARVQSQAP